MKRVTCFAVTLLLVQSQYVNGAVFQGLGDLGGGGHYSYAWGVSADGSTVIGRSYTPSGDRAFRWRSDTGMVNLGCLPEPVAGYEHSTAYDASANGSVVIGTANRDSGGGALVYEAYRWTSGSGMVGLGDLPDGNYESNGWGVSADGSAVVGWSKSNSGTEAFRWTSAGGMVGLGDLGDPGTGEAFYSIARDVSADGSVVVGYGSVYWDEVWAPDLSRPGEWAWKVVSKFEAFRWTSGGGMVGLGCLSGFDFSSAYGVSADGSTVVGEVRSEGGEFQAFRWTADGEMVGLESPSVSSVAYGVSADGSTVIGKKKGGSGYRAFVWDEITGMQDLHELLTVGYGLDLSNWDLIEARGVSDDGTVIVGFGRNPDGRMEAFRAELTEVPSAVPEPSSMVLAAMALVGLLVYAWRKRRNRRSG